MKREGTETKDEDPSRKALCEEFHIFQDDVRVFMATQATENQLLKEQFVLVVDILFKFNPGNSPAERDETTSPPT